MIDKRLFKLVDRSILIRQVIFRLISLLLSIMIWLIFSSELAQLFKERLDTSLIVVVVIAMAVGVKAWLTKILESLTYRASTELRLNIREAVLEKAFRLGKSQNSLSASSLTQLAVDGIEQLEIYYARFLPQLFYCMLASLLIFFMLVIYEAKSALILLVCMPLIPLVIMGVMQIAKRILDKYWSNYTDLGEKFYENLQGLSVLKAYHQDEKKQEEMADNAQRFRKVTMRLLSMQLNSITIMDIISYSGAALGIGLALFAFAQNQVSLTGMFMFILLSAEFFIPMRQLGSLFHVAMNGISACSKLFDYLETPEPEYGVLPGLSAILKKVEISGLNFRYSEADEEEVLKNISLTFHSGRFNAIIGQSGSGKSTFVRVLLNQLQGYEGEIYWNDTELKDLTKKAIHDTAVLVDNQGYLYPVSVRENLNIGNPYVSDEEMWTVLEKVSLADHFQLRGNGLDTVLAENGKNLSGGQRQRLLLARALLSDAQMYIFDEITSGIDLTSEQIILKTIHLLARKKVVIFVSHRLYNIINADQVFVLEGGWVVESGTPLELEHHSNYYKNYFMEEKELLEGGEQG